jgi:hypothetical protein
MKPNPALKLVQDTPSETPTGSRPFTAADVEKLLDRPIAFQRALATIGGGALAGLFLSQALYWSKRTSDRDGWFYKSQDEWHEETALTRREQETVRRALRTRGLIKERRSGLPARLFFQVQHMEILHALEKHFAESEQSRMADSAIQGRRKAPNKSGAIRQTLRKAETTTENTTENTTTAPVVLETLNADSITSLLLEAGVARTVATSLATNHPDESQRQAAYLPFRPNVNDPAGTLIAAIRGTWPPPAAWLKEQRKLETARAEAQQRSDRAQAEQQRQADNAERAERQQREQDQLDAYYKSLPAADRADIDDQAQRRMGAVASLGLAAPGALAATRRNILRKELGMQVEDEQ